MAFDALIRTVFSDSGVAIGVARANAALESLKQAAPGTGRGVRIVETGLRELAFHAAGLPGPLGKVAEGLLKFGGGSVAVLAVSAGIGLVVAAYKLLAVESEKTKLANEALLKSLADIGPAAARHARLVTLQNTLRQLDTDIAGQARSTQPVTAGAPGVGAAGVGLPQPGDVIDLQAQRRKITLDIARLEAEITKENQKQRDEIEKVLRLRPTPTTVAMAGQLTGPPPSWTLASETQLRGRVAPGLHGHEPGKVEAEKLLPGFDPAVSHFQEAAQIAVASFGAMAQAAIGGSEQIATAVIGMITNIVSHLPGVTPLTGTIIGAVGGILGSLFGHGASSQPLSVRVEEYGPRAEDQLTRKRGAPDRQTLQIVLDGKVVAESIIDDVIYRTRRLEAMDATPRFANG